MADPVADAITDLQNTLSAVPSTEGKVLYVYDEDDVISFKNDYGYPLVGILYLGAAGSEDSPRTGLAATITISLLIIGGDQATDKTVNLKAYTLAILNDIRQALACKVFTRAGGGGQRKWQFVNESPAYIDEKLIAYVQTWKTKILLTNA